MGIEVSITSVVVMKQASKPRRWFDCVVSLAWSSKAKAEPERPPPSASTGDDKAQLGSLCQVT